MRQYTKDPVAQQSGTEPPFTGQHWDNHEPGLYVDIGLVEEKESTS